MLHSGEEEAISDKENSEVFLSLAAEKRKHQLKIFKNIYNLHYVLYIRQRMQSLWEGNS